ncbi:hypothetical protein ACJX0J_040935, partial [Zea mays]
MLDYRKNHFRRKEDASTSVDNDTEFRGEKSSAGPRNLISEKGNDVTTTTLAESPVSVYAPVCFPVIMAAAAAGAKAVRGRPSARPRRSTPPDRHSGSPASVSPETCPD